MPGVGENIIKSLDDVTINSTEYNTLCLHTYSGDMGELVPRTLGLVGRLLKTHLNVSHLTVLGYCNFILQFL